MKSGNIVSLNDNTSHTYIEHELTREIIFTFAMNTLARYHVKEWNKLIEAKEAYSNMSSGQKKFMGCKRSCKPDRSL
jgi:hypothetical protein